ncbi:MAG TPA: inositol monophosphatase family protein [Gammaproteobacteria bacterium]|jgi:myo-inositol-1(or 4)-monophosphatase|nr:inositol monophosphatase [Chromatiales bacterium]MCP4926972.1 inositol monophosphatase [Gammaproteobacteria bacterium]MDP7153689.1 inositol monophosphatase family protein [Gammaproteobacteria bacterium]MDP7297422.1 inositol monophosphatase family protein [Gammaproteobacteria bacterium]MDP7660698.1 inositol monophosphatase family protein [Gammaproteobacteria bacterium]
MQALLNTAVKAARRAGEIAIRQLKHLNEVNVRNKGINDFVTQVDEAAEESIIETIQKYYPDHAFLAEESGNRGESEYTWIIDPLDGTTNFIHGLPIFAVSIALRIKGRLSIGVIYDPNRQEIFSAIRGRGAQLEGHKIRVSGRRYLDGALIGTGFPYRSPERMKSYLAMLEQVLLNTAGVRRPGAASLDLANLAAGRLDGFWEFGLNTWDIAAGSLILREAGGLISEIEDQDDYLTTGNIVAGTPRVHDALKKLLTPHL